MKNSHWYLVAFIIFLHHSCSSNNHSTSYRQQASGMCTYPHNLDSSGNRCGGRSAYSREGGEEPPPYVPYPGYYR